MRKVFFSFDWDDVWQSNQVRNSWVTKPNYEVAGFIDVANIEEVKKATDQAIQQWIDKQLDGTSVTCVLIGSETANSRWVNYEIQKSIEKENGLLEVYIHNVQDRDQNTTNKGDSPFSKPPMNFVPVSNLIYPCCFYYDWVTDSGYENLGDWIEKAAKQAGR